MLIRTKHLPAIFMMVAICIMAQSCEKDQPDCTGNCVSIRISGRVYDKTSGIGFKDVPVEVRWTSARIGSTTYKVADGYTDNNGVFDFTKTIDSSYFKNYFISVRIQNDTNYYSVPGISSETRFKDYRFYSLDVNALQQIKFEYYPKAFVKIQLRRVQNDAFNRFSIYTAVENTNGYGYYSIAGQQNAIDTSLLVKTAGSIYTKIITEKTITAGGVPTVKMDSIICTANSTNTITVNY